jgi:DNA-binding CsgD family transcriptional regulator
VDEGADGGSVKRGASPRRAILLGADWPLVGRDQELDLIGEALRRPVGGGIVLAGPPGIGKTRLAHAAVEMAAGTGAETGWVTATAASPSKVLDALTRPDPHRPADGSRRDRGRSVAEQARPRRRLVIGVDNAHLLDTESAALVLQLVSTGQASVVATICAGEESPDAVVALWKDDFTLRLDLEALTGDDVTRLLELVLDGPVERASAQRVYELTEGNPLVVHELVVAGLQGGDLAVRSGLWRWAGMVAAGRLGELVEARLNRLSGAGRSCVELVALAEPVAFDLVEACAGQQALATAERGGALTVGGDDRRLVRTAHPIYGEVLRVTLPVAARRAHCRALARVLAGRRPRCPDELLRLATCLLEAGGDVDQDTLTRAAAAANAVHDHGMALRLAASALAAGGGLEAAIASATALAALDRSREAEEALAAWEEAARSDPDAAVGYLVLRVSVLCAGLGRADDAAALLDRASGWGRGEAWRAAVQVQRVRVLVHQGRYDDAVSTASDTLEDPNGDDTAKLSAMVSVGSALMASDRTDEALALAARGISVARRLGDPSARLSCLSVRFAALLQQGGWTGMEDELVDLYEEGNRRRDRCILGRAAGELGCLHLASGRISAARSWLDEALGHLNQSEPTGRLRGCLAAASYAAGLGGDPTAAAAWRGRAEAAPMATGGSWTGWWHRAVFVLGEVWTLASGGAVTEAQSSALRHADSFGADDMAQAHLLHEALRLGSAPTKVASRLRVLSARCPTPRIRAYGAHAQALAAGAAPDLEEVSVAFDRLGDRLLAAETAAEAAAVHRRAGHLPAALRASGRSANFATGSPGARTPALAVAAREREVEELAARGLSNAAIADRLCLSVRTAETHLQRAYSKLGVRGRENLSSYVGGLAGKAAT